MNILKILYYSWLKQCKYRGKVIFKGKSIKISSRTVFEGKNLVSAGSSIEDSHLGYGSYIMKNSILNYSYIGKYTCIASGVSIIKGQHPVNRMVSLHPAFYSSTGQAGFTYADKTIFEEHRYVEDDGRRWCIHIGNDVWIGEGAKIMEGITIGDGAVIGAGALVTKDIEPYSIVGGGASKSLKVSL